MRSLRWIVAGLVVVGVVAFVRYLIERQETAALRSEIAILQQERERVARLRAEHERLVAGKVSDAELQRLRSDREALNRLRNEINSLETNAEQRAKSVQESPPDALPALVLKRRIGTDGRMLLDDVPADLEAIRKLFAAFAARSERVDVRFQYHPTETRMDLLKQSIESISKIGKDLKLRFTVTMDRMTQ
jgi:hypothetical protein